MLTVSFTWDITGNAATATTATNATKLLHTATITLTGDVSGSTTTFDGSANATIAVTVNNSAKLAGYSPNTALELTQYQ
jgi:hypothetical protein